MCHHLSADVWQVEQGILFADECLDMLLIEGVRVALADGDEQVAHILLFLHQKG